MFTTAREVGKSGEGGGRKVEDWENLVILA